ncbi:MAG: prepilin-type N-terminal cleavage/methylation domain-containing protein [Planctomycetota bacterium]
MTARGLTLIETLISLSLLAVLAGVLTSWTVTSQRIASETADEVRWETAADAVLSMVRDELVLGDFPDPGDRRSTPRVLLVEESSLRWTSRDPKSGAARSRRLRLDQDGQVVVLDETEVLLGRVAEFRCVVIDNPDDSTEDDEAEITPILRLELVSADDLIAFTEIAVRDMEVRQP